MSPRLVFRIERIDRNSRIDKLAKVRSALVPVERNPNLDPSKQPTAARLLVRSVSSKIQPPGRLCYLSESHVAEKGSKNDVLWYGLYTTRYAKPSVACC